MDLADTFKISPRLATVLSTLLTSEVVHTGDADVLVIHRLRKELAPWGITIKTIRSVGYFIPYKDKLYIKSQLAKIEPQTWIALPDGKVDYVNQAWEECYGIPARDALGYGWKKVLYYEDVLLVKPIWERARHFNIPFISTTRRRDVSGKYQWFRNEARPISDSTGKIIRWDGINTPLGIEYIMDNTA